MLFTNDVILLILNILVLSVPEELFLVILSLMLSRRFDFLSFSKQSIIKMLIPTVIVAILTSVLRVFAGFTVNYMPLIGILVLFLSMILVYRFRKLGDIMRCLLCIVVSFVVLGLIQFSFIPAILYGTSITLEDLNKPGLITFITSLPERLIESSIVILVLLRKRSFLRIIPIRTIMKSKMITAIALVVVMCNFVYLYLLTKPIFADKILIHMSAEMQMLILVAVFSFPIANLTALISTVHAFAYKERKKDKYFYDEIRAMRILVNMLIRDQKYHEIEWQLRSFEEQVKAT